VPDILCRKEGLKGPCDHIPGHAGPRIPHGEHDIITWLDFDILCRVRFIQRHIRRFDGEMTAPGHGIARIDGQIEDRIFDLGGIRDRLPKTGSGKRAHCDVLSECPLQYGRHTRRDLVQVERPRLKWLFAREGQHALGELSATLWMRRFIISDLLTMEISGIRTHTDVCRTIFPSLKATNKWSNQRADISRDATPTCRPGPWNCRA
jgi:hypothetical protein